MVFRSKKICRILGWYEIVAGIMGLIMIFFAQAIPVVIFGALVLAGYLLKRQEVAGVYMSLVLQIIQIPGLVIKGLVYQFWAGSSVLVSVSLSTLGAIPERRFDIELNMIGANFNLSAQTTPGFQYIGVNLVAIALTAVFIKMVLERAS